MTREELIRIAEENDTLYVLTVDDALIRSSEYAYICGLSEESVMAFFDHIKNDLGDNPVPNVVYTDLEGISTFAALYQHEDYPAFFMAEYGEIPTELLYTNREKVILDIVDTLLDLPDQVLYAPFGSDRTGITQEFENAIIAQSFYTSEDLLRKYVNDTDYTISPLDPVCVFYNSKGWTPYLFTIDDMVVSGFEFQQALKRYFFLIQMTGEEISDMIANNDLYYLYNKEYESPQCLWSNPKIYTSKDLAKADSDGDKVIHIKKQKDYEVLTAEAGNLAIVLGEDDIRYCTTVDFESICEGEDPTSCVSNMMRDATRIDKTPTLYTLASKVDQCLNWPQPINAADDDADFVHLEYKVFTELEEARDYIAENDIDANIGIIDNTSDNNFRKLILMALKTNMASILVDYKVPLGDDYDHLNLRLMTDGWPTYIGMYDVENQVENLDGPMILDIV